MAQVLVCCEECRGSCGITVTRYDCNGDPVTSVFEPCPVCGGEGEVWAEEPRWSPRILLDEVAAEMWAEEDAP